MRNEMCARCLELFLLGQFEFTTELRKPLDVAFRMKPSIAASLSQQQLSERAAEALSRARANAIARKQLM
jgi:hypothetical protein